MEFFFKLKTIEMVIGYILGGIVVFCFIIYPLLSAVFQDFVEKFKQKRRGKKMSKKKKGADE